MSERVINTPFDRFLIFKGEEYEECGAADFWASRGTMTDALHLCESYVPEPHQNPVFSMIDLETGRIYDGNEMADLINR